MPQPESQTHEGYTPDVSKPNRETENVTPALGYQEDLQERLSSTPQKDLRTPVKSLAHGYYFNGQHFSRTPTARPHLGLLSGGACSPLLQTPGSGGSVSRTANLCRHKTPGSSAKSTPKYTTPGGTSHRIKRNPFDSPGQLDQLQNHVFSPNCFKCTEPGSAEKTPKTFRWSIDQIAELKPATIEEMPIQQDTLNIVKDAKSEAKAQEAIDAYFSQEHVVPSPWSKALPKHVLPATPGTGIEAESCASPMLQYLKETGRFKQTEEHIKPTSNEVGCQTILTLPVDFNLQKVLGEHYMYEDAEMKSVTEDTGPADLSSSSLRRKLFFHGDIGTPLSPVRSGRRGANLEGRNCSPSVSPVRGPRTPQAKVQPNIGAQFSSSPIRGGGDTPAAQRLRRCSTAPNLETFDSPRLSPISLNSHGGYNEEEEFLLHHSADGPLQATPSPGIHADGAMEIPNLSPIRDNNGSYLTSPFEDIRHRPFSSVGKQPPLPLHLLSSPTPTKSTTLHHPHGEELSPQSHDHSHTMDHDVSSSSPRADFRLRLSPEDYDDGVSLMSEPDISDSEGCGASYQSGGLCTASQDTGYHTESMQAGLQETVSELLAGGAHTNLTTQFGHLPLSCDQDITSSQDLQPVHTSSQRFSLHCDNASFEMAIPISTSQVRSKHNMPLPTVSTSEPEFSQQNQQNEVHEIGSHQVSLEDKSQSHPCTITRQISLPEPFPPHPPSIPISISRQPSVSFELSDSIELQASNERSPGDSNGYFEELNEKEIISRARAVLGKEPSMTPEQQHQQQGLPVPGLSWYTDMADTPQRQKLSGLARTLQSRQHDVHSMLPSEAAYEVIRKAGKDYIKVCKGHDLDDTCYSEEAQCVDMSFTSST